MDIDGKTVIYSRMIFYFIENYVILSVLDVLIIIKKSLSLSLFLRWREMCCGELGVSFITAECWSEGFKSGVGRLKSGRILDKSDRRSRRCRLRRPSS